MDVLQDGDAPSQGEGQQRRGADRITTRYLTKFERARVLGTRALQIRCAPAGSRLSGCQPCVFQPGYSSATDSTVLAVPYPAVYQVLFMQLLHLHSSIASACTALPVVSPAACEGCQHCSSLFLHVADSCSSLMEGCICQILQCSWLQQLDSTSMSMVLLTGMGCFCVLQYERACDG